jgi:hypothetical protein
MGSISLDFPVYVIKACDLDAVLYLQPDHPQPWAREWINRGTNQVLRRSSVDMLMRTLDHDETSPSVARLIETSGLRLHFETEKDRRNFATAFAAARTRKGLDDPRVLTAIFDNLDGAESAIAALIRAGVSERSISMLQRVDEASQDGIIEAGHSKLSVALATAGGGIAGTILGISIMAIPSIGPVLVLGAIASKLAAFSGIFGATGGAIARMLTDLDVDSSDAVHIENQIRHGMAFLSIDLHGTHVDHMSVRRTVLQHHGRFLGSCAHNGWPDKVDQIARYVAQLCPA